MRMREREGGGGLPLSYQLLYMQPPPTIAIHPSIPPSYLPTPPPPPLPYKSGRVRRKAEKKRKPNQTNKPPPRAAAICISRTRR